MMKRSALFSLLLLVVMVVSPLAVFAQDGGEMKEFTSADGKLSLSYPADWFIQELGTDFPFPGVALGNSEEALAMAMSPTDAPQAGQQAALVFVAPAAFLDMTGVTLPDNPTLADYAQAFGTIFTSSDDQASDSGMAATEEPGMMATEEAGMMATEAAPMLGEAEEVDLGNGLTAGVVSTNDGEVEGALAARELSDGLFAVAFFGAMPGEFSDELHQAGLDILATVQYSGTADDVMNYMNQMMSAEGTAEPSGAATEQPSDTSMSGSLDGNALVDERCTVCHSRERIDAKDKDEAGWTATVDRMISHGAQLNADERQAVIDYLVATH